MLFVLGLLLVGSLLVVGGLSVVCCWLAVWWATTYVLSVECVLFVFLVCVDCGECVLSVC